METNTTAASIVLATKFLCNATESQKVLFNNGCEKHHDGDDSDDETDVAHSFLTEVEPRPSKNATEINMILAAMKLVKNSLTSRKSLEEGEVIKLEQFLKALDSKQLDGENEVLQQVSLFPRIII